MEKLVIDGDIYAFQYAASGEEWMEIDGWLVPHFDLNRMKSAWAEFLEDLPTNDGIIIALSDSVNFRKGVCPKYKSGRTNPKPIMYKPFIKWLNDTFEVEQYPTLEGDDVMGIYMTRHGYMGITEDKDLGTIPGVHYSVKKKEKVEVSVADANRFWMTQTLTGDPTDGYAGCPGIGKVTAEKLLGSLNDLPSMWEVVCDTYRSKGQSEQDALKQARLSRILRDGDYNFSTKKVNLWNPSDS